MNIDFDRLVELIVRAVVTELLKRGNTIDFAPLEKHVLASPSINGRIKKQKEIDMSAYKTPLLNENSLTSLDPEVAEIVIPHNTIITPGARDIIKKRNLLLIKK